MERAFFGLGAVSAALAVVLGAFAAHGLRGRVPPELLQTFETGAAIGIGGSTGSDPWGGRVRTRRPVRVRTSCRADATPGVGRSRTRPGDPVNDGCAQRAEWRYEGPPLVSRIGGVTGVRLLRERGRVAR